MVLDAFFDWDHLEKDCRMKEMEDKMEAKGVGLITVIGAGTPTIRGFNKGI